MQRVKLGIMLSWAPNGTIMIQMVFPDGIISPELKLQLNECIATVDAEFDQIKHEWIHSDKPGRQGKWPRVVIATDGKRYLMDFMEVVKQEITALKCDVDVQKLGTVSIST